MSGEEIATNEKSEQSMAIDYSRMVSVQQHGNHVCTTCGRRFTRSDILRKHLRTHANHPCNLCGLLFDDKATLVKHQSEVHKGNGSERLFRCNKCDKSFKELRTLRLHLKIHNSEYPEQCKVCQKVFRTKWQLKQHMMDHGGERPYPCPECPFTCKTKQQLNEHRRKHSGEKAYSCDLCGTRFTYRNGLIKHTKLNRCPKKIVDSASNNKKKNKSEKQVSSAPVAAQPTLPPITSFHPNYEQYQSKGFSDQTADILAASSIAELTAATGLNPLEVRAWAESLPVGSTVRVTHHYNNEPVAVPSDQKRETVLFKSGCPYQDDSVASSESPTSSMMSSPGSSQHDFGNPGFPYLGPSASNNRLLSLNEIQEPKDLSGLISLNQQDLESIKTIVEQTFTDGRSMMDVISSTV